MDKIKKIKTALISVYNKEGIEKIVTALNEKNVKIYSTGGTQEFIEKMGIAVTPIEDLTGYPAILDGRVKTLHPKIFGGILTIRDDKNHQSQLHKYKIPEIDLVIVDLYPFEETVEAGASHEEIIEKIDIGGISLIRAAAKNYKDVLVISSVGQYSELLEILNDEQGKTTLEDRMQFASEAFFTTSVYDDEIFDYFCKTFAEQYPLDYEDDEDIEQNPFENDFDEPFPLSLEETPNKPKLLRYGENPHQKAIFFGDFDLLFDQLHGKEVSYNNILDIDAAVSLISVFDETTCAILKHNNACGIASRPTLSEAWKEALAGDPVSAFGGIVVTNINVDADAAQEIDKIFIEVIIAPSYDPEALNILKQKKNRIILLQKGNKLTNNDVKGVLNGFLIQNKDIKTETVDDLNSVTKTTPTTSEIDDLLFANKIVKHSKSNAIVLAKNKRLIGSGVGQTSRVDALKQAISKARFYELELEGAVMASDAFFPFADCAEIAHEAGITAIIQPGGSIRDNETIEYCNNNGMSMVFTGIRHFKH